MSFYCNIALSFYCNIACQNRSSDEGLNVIDSEYGKYRHFTLHLEIEVHNTVKPELPNNDHLSTTIAILEFRFPHLENKGTSEQRTPVNSGHYFWVQVPTQRFDCIPKIQTSN